MPLSRAARPSFARNQSALPPSPALSIVAKAPAILKGRTVAALVTDGSDGAAVKRPVRLGARGVDSVEILEGLRAGEQVVIAGAEGFAGAAQVRIDN